MPSTMAPTKAMARYAVITLSLPANVMRSLPQCALLTRDLMVNRKYLSEKVSLAVAQAGLGFGARRPAWLKNHEINVLKSL